MRLFSNDLSQYLDDATIDAAIQHGRPPELPPVAGVNYHAFIDASAGRHDAFTICIGHRDGEHFTADVIRGRKAPFNPEAVAQEFTALAKQYRCHRLTGDNFAGEWVANAFKKAGVDYRRSPLVKSKLYLEALPHFMRGMVSFPDHAQLIRELRLLERSTHRSGRDSVDHGRGGSDDHANVLAGCINLALGRRDTVFGLPDISMTGADVCVFRDGVQIH